MADNTFPFEILTPERRFFSGEIEALTFTADDGEWTILKNHAPMIVVLRPGALKIKQDGKWREAINSGNGQALVSALNNYLEQFPYDVLGRKEKDFHLALHAFFVSSGFETESEEHSLNGRADLVVKAGSVVYIIELKVDMGAECALSQIEEQGYYKKYLLHASAKNLEIHLMGLSISSKSRNIVDYREKLITGGV